MTGSAAYVTPGHPVRSGAGYDCACGECLALRAERAPEVWTDTPDDAAYRDSYEWTVTDG